MEERNNSTTVDEETKAKETKAEETKSTNSQDDDKRYEQKFAEGARKENKKWLSELGVTSLEEAKAKLSGGAKTEESTNEVTKEAKAQETTNQQTKNENPNDLESIKKEVQSLKAYKLANELGVAKDYVDDAIALCVGRGLEVSEASLLDILKRHPDWRLSANSDATNIGVTKGDTNKQDPDERALTRSLFGLK